MSTSDRTTMGEETSHDEGNVIDLQRASQMSREARIEMGRADLGRHLKQFRALYKQLSAAALKFREQTAISWRECKDVADALQALRKQTNACLELLPDEQAPSLGMFSYYTARGNLERLDGEKTARLILEVDLLRSLVTQSYNENLSQARQRIEMHVALQGSLKEEAKILRELITSLERMLKEPPPPPLPCKST